MQVNLCNIVYVHVCKICETLGGCLWLLAWLDQKVKDSMHSSCRPSRFRAMTYCF